MTDAVAQANFMLRVLRDMDDAEALVCLAEALQGTQDAAYRGAADMCERHGCVRCATDLRQALAGFPNQRKAS